MHFAHGRCGFAQCGAGCGGAGEQGEETDIAEYVVHFLLLQLIFGGGKIGAI